MVEASVGVAMLSSSVQRVAMDVHVRARASDTAV